MADKRMILVEEGELETIKAQLSDIQTQLAAIIGKPSAPELITIEQASTMLHRSKRTVYNYIKREIIRSKKVGTSVMIYADSIY